jgi:phage shock protein A
MAGELGKTVGQFGKVVGWKITTGFKAFVDGLQSDPEKIQMAIGERRTKLGEIQGRIEKTETELGLSRRALKDAKAGVEGWEETLKQAIAEAKKDGVVTDEEKQGADVLLTKKKGVASTLPALEKQISTLESLVKKMTGIQTNLEGEIAELEALAVTVAARQDAARTEAEAIELEKSQDNFFAPDSIDIVRQRVEQSTARLEEKAAAMQRIEDRSPEGIAKALKNKAAAAAHQAELDELFK